MRGMVADPVVGELYRLGAVSSTVALRLGTIVKVTRVSGYPTNTGMVHAQVEWMGDVVETPCGLRRFKMYFHPLLCPVRVYCRGALVSIGRTP